MSFMMVGSLNSYANTMKMQMKWEQKKASGNYSSDETTSIVDQLRKEAAEKTSATQSSSNQATMSSIQAKMMAGKKLSSAEMEYLKQNDPDTYQHAKAMEMERKAFEQRLRNCKTKEEVQRLKASQMAASLDKVKEINNNPNIPSGEKLKLTIQEHQKVCAVTDTTVKFTESGDYKKLPTEAEKRKAEKDLKEAREAERKGETKEKKEIKEEKADDLDAAEAKQPEDESTGKEIAGTRNDADSHKKEPTPADTQAAKAREIFLAAKKTRVEAELTPEAQKVKRSKARAVYAQNMHSEDTTVTIDVKK